MQTAEKVRTEAFLRQNTVPQAKPEEKRDKLRLSTSVIANQGIQRAEHAERLRRLACVFCKPRRGRKGKPSGPCLRQDECKGGIPWELVTERQRGHTAETLEGSLDQRGGRPGGHEKKNSGQRSETSGKPVTKRTKIEEKFLLTTDILCQGGRKEKARPTYTEDSLGRYPLGCGTRLHTRRPAG